MFRSGGAGASGLSTPRPRRPVPSASRVAVGEGWTSRTGVPSRGPPFPPNPGSVTNQHDAAVEKGDVRYGRHPGHVAYPHLVHGDGPQPVESRWAEGVDKAERAFHREAAIPTEPGVVRIRTTRQLKKGDVRYGRHQARGLSTPRPRRRSPASRSRGGRRGGQAERAFHREAAIPTEPRGRTNQHDAAVEKGDVRYGGTRHVAYPRLVHGDDGPPASRVAVGEGWISRTGVPSRGRHATEPGVTNPHGAAIERAMFGSGGTTRKWLIHAGCTTNPW